MATTKTPSIKTSPTKVRAVPATPRKAQVPLIVESHPKDYSGFPFITLIQYRKQPMLAIVDNADNDILRVFVLDMCGPERVDEETIISVAAEWYATNRVNFPISIEFSRRGMTAMTTRIYRSLPVEFVSRVIGPVPKYPMGNVKSIKRRRRKMITAGVEVNTMSAVSGEELFQ